MIIKFPKKAKSQNVKELKIRKQFSFHFQDVIIKRLQKEKI